MRFARHPRALHRPRTARSAEIRLVFFFLFFFLLYFRFSFVFSPRDKNASARPKSALIRRSLPPRVTIPEKRFLPFTTLFTRLSRFRLDRLYLDSESRDGRTHLLWAVSSGMCINRIVVQNLNSRNLPKFSRSHLKFSSETNSSIRFFLRVRCFLTTYFVVLIFDEITENQNRDRRPTSYFCARFLAVSCFVLVVIVLKKGVDVLVVIKIGTGSFFVQWFNF